MDLDEIKREVNLIEYAKTHYGYKCDSKGRGSCLFHPPDKHPSFSIWKDDDGIWRFKCFHEGTTGTIVDLKAKLESKSEEDSIKKLLEEFEDRKPMNKERGKGKKSFYTYRGIDGKEVYRKVKLRNKDDRKSFWFEIKDKTGWRKPKENEKYEKIPYNLNRFNNHKGVIICEGERDADTITSLNIKFLATSAPTGKGSWPDSQTKYFEHFNDVTFLYDVGNDEDVNKHAAKLQEAFPNMEIYVAKVPLEKKEADITDYLNQVADKEKALQYIMTQRKRFEVADKPITTTPKKKINRRKELIINNKFLETYIDTISRVTDAPKIFILFSGIALLSGVLNKFYFMYPDRTQLNLYILLLAPSTYYRKTTIIEIAGRYLNDINPSLQLPESFTTEALYEILKKYPRGLISWRELIQIKEFQMKSEYNKGLPAFLTDLYDYKQNWKRWTKGDGEITLEEPAIISILAGGITGWFVKNLSELDFQGGLWTRFLFVPVPEEERTFRLPGREVTNPALTGPLKELDNLEAKEINLSKILPLMEKWGAKHQTQSLNLNSGLLQAQYQRLEVMLLKLAALLQLSHDQSTIVLPESFNEAVKVIEYIKQLLPTFFEEEIQFTSFNQAKGRVKKLIKKKGKIMRRDLLQGGNVSANIANEVTIQLEEEGDIMIEEFTPDGGGKKGKMYEWIGKEE